MSLLDDAIEVSVFDSDNWAASVVASAMRMPMGSLPGADYQVSARQLVQAVRVRKGRRVAGSAGRTQMRLSDCLARPSKPYKGLEEVRVPGSGVAMAHDLHE